MSVKARGMGGRLIALVAALGAASAFAEKTPWTHLNYLDDSDEFRFAVIPDRQGGDYRTGKGFRGAFTNAINAVNLLRPNFVISVGDLIPFGWKDEASIRRQHEEVNEHLARIVPPFFYVVGNHDIAPSAARKDLQRCNEVSTKVWREFRGEATYYSFVYKNCLFVALNTIDDVTVGSKHRNISERQYAWFKETLKSHLDVRWTFVFMHQPAVWATERWLKFELESLVSRKYTVFAGDWHTYLHVRRHGHDYYVLATAGGCASCGVSGKDMDRRAVLLGREYGEMDHLAWVTMTKDGPSIVNLDLKGIVPHDFINQRTTLSMEGGNLVYELDYPTDPKVREHQKELRARKDAILKGNSGVGF